MNNKIDILIPLVYSGSRVDDFELRMCLRSIEKHLSNVGNIYIVGHLPSWCKNVIHIPYEDSPHGWERAHNIYNKVMAGCANEALSQDFLFMNDDHFLLTNYTLPNFPYYHRGPIDLPRLEVNQPQLKQMRNTKNAIGVDALDYDVHSPIMYNNERFVSAFINLLWPEYGYGVKSIYGNKNIAPDITARVHDVKFHKPMTKEDCYAAIEGLPWFSTGDAVLLGGGMMECLQELYPLPSKYEL